MSHVEQTDGEQGLTGAQSSICGQTEAEAISLQSYMSKKLAPA